MIDRGQMNATGGVLEMQSLSSDETASAVFLLDDFLPSYYEVLATFNLDKPTGGWKSNGYVIFDYYSDVDFKFAGLNISTNKIEMGYVDESGWHYLVQSNKPVKVKPNENYQVTVAVNGNNVTVAVAGVNWFSYDYTPRYDVYGEPIPLNGGMVGVAMDGSSGRLDNFTVQILPPDWTYDESDDFTPPAEITRNAVSGDWSEAGDILGGTANPEPAVQIVDLGAPLLVNSILEFEVDITTSGTAGYVFDRYDASDYKFVALDVANDRVIIGHSTADDGIVVDASFDFALDENSSHHLKLTMQGAGLGFSVDGSPVTSYGFNAALVDGEFGLLVLDGTASFDDLEVRTNDAQFADEQALLAAGALDAIDYSNLLTRDELASLVDAASRYWIAEGQDPELLSDIQVEITDLPGQQLGRVHGNTIYIDYNAAGYGWFVDSTPFDSDEYRVETAGGLSAVSDSTADGRMDLLSVVIHEIGHLLGEDHDDSTLMDRTLEAGVREVDIQVDGGTIAVAADSVVDSLDSGNILVTTTPLWREQEISDAPRAQLPNTVNRDGMYDALRVARPGPLLVFDEVSGEFVEVERGKAASAGELPLPAHDESGDDDGDWKVYEAADGERNMLAGDLRQTLAAAATAIDWNAESGDINFLIPPLLPGRTGIGNGSRKQDMA